MEQYYFLFSIALAYALTAAIFDLKTREVPNWLNFSLIAFALAYRLFFSIYYDRYDFIIYGLLGFLVFYLIANAFYYSKVFAGGDAKLLMGLGCILPFESLGDLFYIGAGFIFSESRKLFIFSSIIIVLLLIETVYFSSSYLFFLISLLFFLLLPILYIYLKTIESSCMIKMVSSKIATEGDWLEKDIKVGGKIIKKSVHGLSREEIMLLRKHNKKIWIKYGIPFVPAFFLAIVFTVFFFLFLQADIQSFFYSLF